MKEKCLCLIAAVSQNGVYGEGDNLPWNIAQDFLHFKNITMGHAVVMGRGTWESLPKKNRPLPGRDNIIITNTPKYKVSGAGVAPSLLHAVSSTKKDKVFFIGGADIWMGALPLVDELFVTVVCRDYPITQGVTRLAKELVVPENSGHDFKCICVSDGFCKDSLSGDMINVHFKHYIKR